jgi:hypothetical protein
MSQFKNYSLEFPKLLQSVEDPNRRAIIEARLAKFEQQKNKQAILRILSEVRENAATPSPFDAKNSWRYLIGFAEYYFWMITGGESVPPAIRRKRLHKLAAVLDEARVLFHEMLEDDAGADLFYAWWGGPSDPDADGVCLDQSHFERLFRKQVAVLANLAEAGHRAANDVRRADGRPKGTGVFRKKFVVALAAVYRFTTDEKPGAGDGPFAKFVCAVLDALGRYNDAEDGRVADTLTYLSVVDLTKEARAWSLAPPFERLWGSPFGE